MRNLDQVLDSTSLTAEAKSFVRVELLTGCARCGRRLLSENNSGLYIRDGVAMYAVDDEYGRNVAAYALCEKCSQ